MMTGGVLSSTVIICMQLAELPQSSVTVCVRVMVPPHAPPTSGPLLQLYVNATSQLSEADAPGNKSNAANEAGQAGTSASQDTVIFVGQVIMGGVTSFTSTTSEHIIGEVVHPSHTIETFTV